MKRAFVMGLVVLRMAELVESDTANIDGKGFCADALNNLPSSIKYVGA
ncbi:MAG: hypothetical protein V2A53_05140 [bacterium]